MGALETFSLNKDGACWYGVSFSIISLQSVKILKLLRGTLKNLNMFQSKLDVTMFMFIVYQNLTSMNHALHYLMAALQLHQITVEPR